MKDELSGEVAGLLKSYDFSDNAHMTFRFSDNYTIDLSFGGTCSAVTSDEKVDYLSNIRKQLIGACYDTIADIFGSGVFHELFSLLNLKYV